LLFISGGIRGSILLLFIQNCFVFYRSFGFVLKFSGKPEQKIMFSCFVFLVLGFCTLFSLARAECKATPSNSSWPSTDVWTAFNSSLGGHLIQPTPPGAVCHTDQESYNAATCLNVQTEWSTYPFHRADPVSSAWNNYNNDTCLPEATYSCSGKGYPAFVVNATSEEHVVLGVQFARKYGIRLIVKATGHDYMGRYVFLHPNPIIKY
jgi:hypothetical protein